MNAQAKRLFEIYAQTALGSQGLGPQPRYGAGPNIGGAAPRTRKPRAPRGGAASMEMVAAHPVHSYHVPQEHVKGFYVAPHASKSKTGKLEQVRGHQVHPFVRAAHQVSGYTMPAHMVPMHHGGARKVKPRAPNMQALLNALQHMQGGAFVGGRMRSTKPDSMLSPWKLFVRQNYAHARAAALSEGYAGRDANKEAMMKLSREWQYMKGM